MSSSLQRLKSRLTGNIFGQSNKAAAVTSPDIGRGSQSGSDTSQFGNAGSEFDYGVFQYPEDLGNNDFGHYILFHIYERTNSKYVNPTASRAARMSGDKDGFGTHDRTPQEGITRSSTVTGKNVQDGTEVLHTSNTGIPGPQRDLGERSGLKLSAAQRSGFSTSYNLRNEHFKQSKDTIALYMPPGIGASYKHDYKNSETGIAGYATGQMEKMRNEAPNPALEAIFTGTGFRSFSYNFRFTPRTENEVRVVDDIVKLFKFHAAPERMFGEKVGRHFRMPAEFDIFYMYQGQQNTWYPMIHSCVCNGVSVTYGAGGESQHFRKVDGSPAPIETNMALEFTETEVITKELIKEGF